MRIQTQAPVFNAIHRGAFQPGLQNTTPPAPSEPSDSPDIDWKSIGKSAAVGAALYGIPAALGAVNPVAGMVGALGVGVYAAWATKNPRSLVIGAFIGMPAANLGNHWGVVGALGIAAAGALSMGGSNYIGQRFAEVEEPRQPLTPTPDDVQGPYYRENAPMRENLFPAGEQGTPISYEYNVVGVDGQPIEGATVDIWTADSQGVYDMESEEFRGRARAQTNAEGASSFSAIRPGNYDLGLDPNTGERLFRPAHVHVKVSAPGHEPLLTQLYFADDQYNEIDPIIDREEGERGFDPVLLQEFNQDKSSASYQFVLGSSPSK